MVVSMYATDACKARERMLTLYPHIDPVSSLYINTRSPYPAQLASCTPTAGQDGRQHKRWRAPQA